MAIQIKRILVPLDFSDHAESILAWASHLAEEHGSSLILMHAYHLPVEFQQMEGAYLPAEFWTQVKTRPRRAWRATPQRFAPGASRSRSRWWRATRPRRSRRR